MQFNENADDPRVESQLDGKSLSIQFEKTL